MKRNMELLRTILFEIEELYVDTSIRELRIDGYTKVQIAYHCKLMYEAGLVSEYKPSYSDQGLLTFYVGSLTWKGQDYLEQIRNPETWEKTMKVIKEKKLPKKLDTIAKVAGIFTGNVINELKS